MNSNRAAAIILVLCGIPFCQAGATAAKSNPVVEGTIINIQRTKTQSPDYSTAGSNPADAPLTSRYYSYEIAVRVNCRTYAARYDSPFNALVLPLNPDEHVPVRVTKDTLQFDFPDNPDVRMAIVHRTNNCDGSCGRKP